MNDDDCTGWFVGIIIALALLAIGYLVFSSNSRSEAVRCVDTHEETRWVKRDANEEDRRGPYVETWVPLKVTVCDSVAVPR